MVNSSQNNIFTQLLIFTFIFRKQSVLSQSCEIHRVVIKILIDSLSRFHNNVSTVAFYTPPKPSECEAVRRRMWPRVLGSVVDMLLLAMISIVNVYL